MIFIVLSVLVVVLLIARWLMTKEGGDLELIPGPSTSPWRALFTKAPNYNKLHLQMYAMKKKYGPMFKLPQFGEKSIIFLTDYDEIYQVLIKQGKEFGGRRNGFRMTETSAGTGILFNAEPDNTWKTLRKTSQRHLKQFGDGLTHLESSIGEVVNDMLTDFKKKEGTPYDPKQIIFDTALLTIAFLITGERSHLGDPLIVGMREYESLILKMVSPFVKLSLRILDVFPWTRYFGVSDWKFFVRFSELETEIWKRVKGGNHSSGSICKVLIDHMNNQESNLNEIDAKKTALTLLLAGVTTTSNTFYAAVNILAHHKQVQQKILAEIQEIKEKHGRQIKVTDRSSMPYTRAVILELLRYVTVTPNGVVHRTRTDTVLNGYQIPADYRVITVLWTLHHDEDFWDDSFSFIPERFLDEDGEMVPADHPNRKHLMPFGAGLRVCLGESLALNRLFLWLTALVDQFDISPAKGNEKWMADCRSYYTEAVMRPTQYQVLFAQRS